MFGFTGCGGKKYKVDYEGRKSSFDNAKDYYREGEKVEVYFSFIATDTDYSFYVDGQRYNAMYDNKHGYVISFTMPAHDVRIGFKSVNSMIYDPNPVFEEYVEIDYFTGSAGLEYGGYSTEYILTRTNYDNVRIEVVKTDDGKSETKTYNTDSSVIYRCNKIINKGKLREWQYLEDYETIDGEETYCTFRNDDGSRVTVSVGKMPSDGEQWLGKIQAEIEKEIAKIK